MEQPDIELEGDKKKEAIAIIKRNPFENLKVDKHYFSDINPNMPRHGVSLEEAKRVYSQFNKIICVTYRNSGAGRKYCFYYRINKRQSYKLLFFLDRNPPCIFNAMRSGRNVELKLLKKFGFR